MNVCLQFVDHSPKVNEPENVKWKYIFNFKINCVNIRKNKQSKSVMPHNKVSQYTFEVILRKKSDNQLRVTK